MNHVEHDTPSLPEEDLNPRHFYAAYVFDAVQEHLDDIAAVIATAREFEYPVRYWWLSRAMKLEKMQDRLIICVHHDVVSDEAGLDLYDTLKEHEIEWDFLESASVGEYRSYGQSLEDKQTIQLPNGTPLFPLAAEDEQ